MRVIYQSAERIHHLLPREPIRYSLASETVIKPLDSVFALSFEEDRCRSRNVEVFDMKFCLYDMSGGAIQTYCLTVWPYGRFLDDYTELHSWEK